MPAGNTWLGDQHGVTADSTTTVGHGGSAGADHAVSETGVTMKAPVYVEHAHCNRCGKRVSGFDPELGLVVRAWVECPECLEQTTPDSFAEWLTRQIAAAKAQYEATTTKGRKQRHWDAFLLLAGIQAEYARRTR